MGRTAPRNRARAIRRRERECCDCREAAKAQSTGRTHLTGRRNRRRLNQLRRPIRRVIRPFRLAHRATRDAALWDMV